MFCMWQKSYSVVTREVTREQLWKLTTDINRWKQWDDTVEDSRLLGEFRAGDYFMLKPAGGPRVKIQLLEIVPFRKFVDLTRFPLARMYGEHVYEETAQGLKITVTMTVKGLLGPVWVRLVAGGIVANLEKDVANQIQNARKL